jgi:hypothetical protein
MGVEQEDAWLPSRWEHGRPRRGCARRGGRVAVTYSQVAENSGLGGKSSCMTPWKRALGDGESSSGGAWGHAQTQHDATHRDEHHRDVGHHLGVFGNKVLHGTAAPERRVHRCVIPLSVSNWTGME